MCLCLHRDQKGSAAPLSLLMCSLRVKIEVDLRSVLQLNSQYSPFYRYANPFFMWNHKVDNISSYREKCNLSSGLL